MKTIIIGNRKIGLEHEPFIIAEMSGNHNQDLNRALKLVEAAAKAGAHALKLQTYTADTMTLDCDNEEFLVKGSATWDGQKLYDLYEKAHTPWEWHPAIFEYAKKLGMLAFSSPFDDTAVDFLEALNVPCYKIASFENNDIPLLKKVAQTGKPVIMSCGMASENEINEALLVLKENGCKDIILLKCTSAYPSLPQNANLATIPYMKEIFAVQVGLSDHSMGNTMPIAAIALGATVIEKHFTLSRAEGGVDSHFSLEPSELKELVESTKCVWQALGEKRFGGCGSSEQASKIYRRSIYVAKNISAGEKFTKENIRCVRPSLGLSPKHYENILGEFAKVDLSFGTPLSFDHIK
jgi:pseudaminic acid synthase